MTGYLAVVAQYGAAVELMEPDTPWAWNPVECARRNVHGVPLDVIRAMLARFQPMCSAEAQAVVDAMRQEG